MKRVGIGMALVILYGHASAQFLGGIFSQGATELKQNAAQIVALQALGATSQEGYEALEDGLTGIGQIHGTEYALHQQYFASLTAVNPAVAGMPEVADIVSTVPAMFGMLTARLDRWRLNGGLTFAELSALTSMDSTIVRLGAAELQRLQTLLTAGSSTMTDAERMSRVGDIDHAVRDQLAFVMHVCSDGDLLVSYRLQAAGQVGAMLGSYGGP